MWGLYKQEADNQFHSVDGGKPAVLQPGGGRGGYLQGRDRFIVSVDTAHGDKYSWYSLKYLVFCHLFHST